MTARRTSREVALRLVATRESSPRSPAFAVAKLRAEAFGLVYRQMLTLAGRSQDFDDLVQMSAEQVFRSLAKFEHQCAPETWTYRICYNTLMKQRRWYHRWIRRFTLAETDEFPFEATPMPTDRLDRLDHRERAARLYAALDRLSERRRTVVVLHDLDGLDIEEIAVIVGGNVNTVRSRLRDGRKLLAQVLQDDPYFGDEACRKTPL